MARAIRLGLWQALANALRVLGAGLVAFAAYLALVIFGPGVEGWAAPVITNYQLHDVRRISNGGFSFRPTFTKTRDCTYYGVSWFAQDKRGNLTRVQIVRGEPSPPTTGPTGERTGDRMTLYPPNGTTAIFGLNHHDCGMPWQTRTMVGPFSLIDGRLQAHPSPIRFAFARSK